MAASAASTSSGRSDNGRSDHGHSEKGRSEKGRSEKGRSEKGRSEKGRSEKGRSEKGRSGPPDRPKDMPKSGWVAILKRSVKQFKHDDVTDRAAALTYFGVLAIFPAVLALISVLGLLGKSTTDKILSNVKEVAPGGVSSFLEGVINQVGGKAGAAGIAGIVGILLALYSASGYVSAFTRASNAIYEVDEGRPIWKTLPLRFLVTLALVIMLALSAIMVLVTGPITSQVGKAFGVGHTAVLIWEIAKWPVLLIIVSLMFSLLYRACPNVKQPGMRWISLGGLIAVVVWLIASGLFAVYVSFSGSYNKTYGSFATIIIFLVWLWISNIALLLGAEFNAESQREQAIRAGLPEDTEPFVELRDTSKLQDSEKRRVEAADRERNGAADHDHS